ncbi:MAG TPA: molybdopterin molybdenumtransferase MoeA, partial [bacterium]
YRRERIVLADKISSQIGRVDYARVRVENGKAVLLATSGASLLSSTTRADGFIAVDQDSEGFAAGEAVDVWMYD